MRKRRPGRSNKLKDPYLEIGPDTRRKEMALWQTAMNTEGKTSERPGVVYRTVCQNPGCGATFDLRITPQNASLLSGMMACPRCRRHGGSARRRAEWTTSCSLPSCSTGRPVWPRRWLTKTSRCSARIWTLLLAALQAAFQHSACSRIRKLGIRHSASKHFVDALAHSLRVVRGSRGRHGRSIR